MEARYINPYTDFGFKYLFGTEPNKDITLEQVNALLQGQETITNLTLLPMEQLGGWPRWQPFQKRNMPSIGKARRCSTITTVPCVPPGTKAEPRVVLKVVPREFMKLIMRML